MSEALNLCLPDFLPDGILQIRGAKFGKSRLVPLHPTTVTALDSYLENRRRLAVTDDHVFLSAGNQRIHISLDKNTRSEEHTSELQSHLNLVCRLLLEKKKNTQY